MALIPTKKIIELKQQMRRKRVMLLTEENQRLTKELVRLPREQYKSTRWWQIRRRTKEIRKELSILATYPPADSGEQKTIKFD